MTEPIACRLSRAEFGDRAAEWRAVAPGVRRIVLTFEPRDRAPVDALVAAESECCPFLRIDVREDELTVEAPEGGEGVLRDLAGLILQI